MAGFSEAMQEAFASAPVNEIIYHTIELDHPAFTQPIRLVGVTFSNLDSSQREVQLALF